MKVQSSVTTRLATIFHAPAKNSLWLFEFRRPYPRHAAALSLPICGVVLFVAKTTFLSKLELKSENMIDGDAHKVVVLISAGIAVRKCGTLGVDCRIFREPCLVHAHRRRVAPAGGDCLV